jgi:hypothetical protein
MAPLIVESAESDAFSAARFSLPLRNQLPAFCTEERRRRRVKFGGHSIINWEPEYYDDADVETKWWTAKDLKGVRRDAKVLSGDLRCRSAGSLSSCFLSLAHRKTTLMLSSDFKSLMKLSRTTPDQDLHQWCAWNDGRRGLERFSSQTYWCFRKQDLSNFRIGVVEEHLRQKEEGRCDPDAIAEIAQESSRRSRTFSLFMGEADALEAASIMAEATPVRRAPPRKKSRIESFEEDLLAV